MKQFLVPLLIITSCLAYNCQRFPTENDNSDRISNVPGNDSEMNRIIAEARKTFREFYRIYENRKANQRDFSVKYPFATDPGSRADTEHIWLSDLSTGNGRYYGVVSNDPAHIKKMKLGDRVEYSPEKISDWKYIENNYLVGGKSIIYLLKDLPGNERKKVLKGIDFRIKDFE